jgi:hypothetical protein
MGRRLFGSQESDKKLNLEAGTAPLSPLGATLSGARLEQRLRQQRSKAYLDGVRRLDAGTHQQNKAALDALIQEIAAEFPELTIDQRPLGLVSRCYLGAPFLVHTCDLMGNIVEHYESFRAMPPLFERARALALHSAYEFIEVYPDSLRAISADGSVSVIQK